MNKYEAVIAVEPIGKARPRMTRSGHVYTPLKTIEFEGVVRAVWQLQTNSAKGTGCYIMANIVAGFKIPKSWSKKKKAEWNGKPHTSRPDADNVAKAVLDALNGVAYDDDSYVIDLRVRKIYSVDPFVKVELEYISPEEYSEVIV